MNGNQSNEWHEKCLKAPGIEAKSMAKGNHDLHPEVLIMEIQMQNLNPMMAPEQTPQEFYFHQYRVVDHPHYPYRVQWHIGTLMDVHLPLGQPPIRFDLARFPLNTWVGLQDHSGSPIPVMVYVDSRGLVLGKWLP